MNDGRIIPVWQFGLFTTLAWGIGAFGSPYAWAYQPLLIACGTLGALGIWFGRKNSNHSLCLVCSFFLVSLAIVAQLIPMSIERLTSISPRAVDFFQLNLSFSVGYQSSHPLSIDPQRTRLGLAFFSAFALLLIGTSRALRRESAIRQAGILVILGVALAVVGIVQRAMFNGKIYGFWEVSEGATPFGPNVNRNHFAGWMLMGLPVAVGYLFALVSRGLPQNPRLRNLLEWFSTAQSTRAITTGFAILVMALALVLTMSRSGMLSLAVAFTFASTVMARRQTGRMRRAVSVAFILFIVMTVVLWVGLETLQNRFSETSLEEINRRPAIWADTIRIVEDFWLTGTGLNTYGISTLLYQKALPGLHVREAHNDYLQLLAEGGVMLGAPIALALFAFAFEVRRRLREDVGSIWWIRMGAVVGLIAIALQSVVEFSLQMPGNAATFAVVAGLAIHDGRR